MLTVKVLHS